MEKKYIVSQFIISALVFALLAIFGFFGIKGYISDYIKETTRQEVEEQGSAVIAPLPSQPSRNIQAEQIEIQNEELVKSSTLEQSYLDGMITEIGQGYVKINPSGDMLRRFADPVFVVEYMRERTVNIQADKTKIIKQESANNDSEGISIDNLKKGDRIGIISDGAIGLKSNFLALTILLLQ